MEPENKRDRYKNTKAANTIITDIEHPKIHVKKRGLKLASIVVTSDQMMGNNFI